MRGNIRIERSDYKNCFKLGIRLERKDTEWRNFIEFNEQIDAEVFADKLEKFVKTIRKAVRG